MKATKECLICGRKIKTTNYQARKELCHKCAYELKKLRMAVAYNLKTNNPKLKLYKKQLEVYNNLIKNK